MPTISSKSVTLTDTITCVDCGPDTVSIERVSAEAGKVAIPVIINAKMYLNPAERNLVMAALFYDE